VEVFGHIPEELRKFGKAARYMVSPTANMGKPPLPTFVLQLEEARAEWRRRQRPAQIKTLPPSCDIGHDQTALIHERDVVSE
jgi:hypothetical protein